MTRGPRAQRAIHADVLSRALDVRRQGLHLHLRAVGPRERALDHAFELAHIAGPRVSRQGVERLSAERDARGAMLGQKILGERPDVSGPF